MKERNTDKRNKTRLLIAVSLLVFILTAGITFAYMFKVTDPLTNIFTKAVISCRVVEQYDPQSGIKSHIRVENDTGNIDEYIRVKLVSYWIDSDGNVIAKQANIPSFAFAENDWTYEGNDVYRCKTIVKPGQLTPDLLALNETITLPDADPDGSRQVIEIFAEAIQTNAVAEWDN